MLSKEEKLKRHRDSCKKYRENNPDKVRESHQKSYEKHKEENLEKNREKTRNWRQKHKDEVNEKHRELRKDPEYRAKEAIYKKKYREEHSQEHKEYMKKWHSENNNAPAKYDVWYEKISPYYNSSQIRRDPNNPELIQIKCHLSTCTNWVNPTYDQISHRYRKINEVTGGECHIYCSERCKQMCPSFKQRTWPKDFNVNYERDDQPQLRELVLERDNYTCQREGCGKSLAEYPDLKLICHHIFPLNEDPIESVDVDNCITVCVDCHRWIHQNVPGCSFNELKCSK